MKILVAIDGSAHSELALQRAAQFAGEAAEVSVLTVSSVVNFATFGGLGYALDSPYETPTREEVAEILAKATDYLRERGITPRTVHRIGTPADSILAEAETQHPDLIVIGSHGRSGVTRFLLGSVSSAVVSHAPCTVLVAKAPAYASPAEAPAQSAAERA